MEKYELKRILNAKIKKDKSYQDCLNLLLSGHSVEHVLDKMKKIVVVRTIIDTTPQEENKTQEKKEVKRRSNYGIPKWVNDVEDHISKGVSSIVTMDEFNITYEQYKSAINRLQSKYNVQNLSQLKQVLANKKV